MSIACDARALVGPSTGVGTWTTNVAGGLAERGHRVMLASPSPVDLPPRLRRDGVEVLPESPVPLPGTLWLHTVLRRQLVRASARVFIGSLAVIPRRCPVPSVAVVHDLTPRTHPTRHTLANRFCFNAYLEESLDRADAVVAGSLATERELLDHFPFVRRKLSRIGYGVDSFFAPADPGDDGARTRSLHAGGSSYLLHLGTLEPRKGIRDLVEAYRMLRLKLPAAPDLVVAGGAGWGVAPIVAAIEASPVRDHIHLTGYLRRDEVRDLLRHAEVFVLASEAEGFGLPLAEAISCGTPSVASDIPPLREAGGNAALFTPPGDPEALAATIEQALQPQTALELRRRAAEHAPGLRWGPVVDGWHELLERVVRDAGLRS